MWSGLRSCQSVTLVSLDVDVVLQISEYMKVAIHRRMVLLLRVTECGLELFADVGMNRLLGSGLATNRPSSGVTPHIGRQVELLAPIMVPGIAALLLVWQPRDGQVRAGHGAL